MSERQRRALMVLSDPTNRGVILFSRTDRTAIAQCLADRDELLSRIKLDAERFREFARYASEAGVTGLAKKFTKFATEAEHVIARAEKGDAS